MRRGDSWNPVPAGPPASQNKSPAFSNNTTIFVNKNAALTASLTHTSSTVLSSLIKVSQAIHEVAQLIHKISRAGGAPGHKDGEHLLLSCEHTCLDKFTEGLARGTDTHSVLVSVSKR